MPLTNPYEVQGVFKHAVRDFSGGILEDKRIQSPVHFSITKHFDTYTYPQKIVPYAQTVAANGISGASVKTLNINKFVYAPNVSGYHLVGMGVDSNGYGCLYALDIGNAANGTALNALDFTAIITNFPVPYSGMIRNSNMLFVYKGWVYWFNDGSYGGGGLYLLKSDPTNMNQGSVIASALGTSISSVIQPVHHPLDDIAYFFVDNIIYALNGSSWNGAVLTLPSTEIITAACAFGTYLAVATSTNLGGLGTTSKVYLWDRDSSLTTITEVEDWGEGAIMYLASLNNKLIGVQDFYTQDYRNLGKGKMYIKEASGEFGVVLNTLTTDTVATRNVIVPPVVKENKLYFPAQIELDGDIRQGIWCVDSKGVVALDTIEPAIAANTGIDGIFSVANLWFIAHSEDGSVTHTDATNTYSSTNPSIYESLIFSTIFITGRGIIIQNPAMTKKLIGAIVMTEPLTTGQSVVMKYRTDTDLDDATAWTTILTHNTVGQTTHYALNIESTGGDLPNYNEIQFRLESYGGAVITGFEYAGEVIDNGLM